MDSDTVERFEAVEDRVTVVEKEVAILRALRSNELETLRDYLAEQFGKVRAEFDKVGAEFDWVRAEFGKVWLEFDKVRAENAVEFAKMRSENALEFAKMRSENALEFARIRTEMAARFGEVDKEFGKVRSEISNLGYKLIAFILTTDIAMLGVIHSFFK